MTRSLLLLLCCAVLVIAGCRQAEPVPISLLDQVDPAEPLGPWRLAAEVRGMRVWAAGSEGLGIVLEGQVIDVRSMADFTRKELKLASRVMGKGGAFLQTAPVSIYRHPVKAESGESVLLGLRYRVAWTASPRVEIRLLKSGVVVASTDSDVDGHWCEARLAVPSGGADTLEIRHHLEPGTSLPLGNATVLVLDSAAHRKELSRAMLFLRLARGDRAFPVVHLSAKRVFPLKMDGRTLDVLLLSSGETRGMVVPPALAGRRLIGWFTVLDAGQSGTATLSLEAETGEGWRPLAILPVRAEGAGSWTEVCLEKEEGLPPGCGRIRFSLAGGEAIVGISGPILPAGRRPKDRKNLLIVDLDTLRADRMETYGYSRRPTTGRLDAMLDDQGFHLFEHAYSPAVSTLPATAKFLAGRYHDIHLNGAVPRGYMLLQEWLRDAGYYCAAFTGGGQLRCPGFEQGFHDYYWSEGVGKIEDSFPQATAWLEENADELFFLFLHTYETHAPYTRGEFCAGLPRGRLGDLTAGELLLPKKSGIQTHSLLSEQEKQYVNAAYDSGVKKATDEVALLLAELERLGLSDSTVVVILSDHGEEFWDHNELFAYHGQSLYGELLNIPLIIFDPDNPGNGLHRITEEVSTVDLLPTVLDLLDLPFTGAADGASLVPLIEGGEGSGSFHREIPVLASKLDKSYCVIRDGVKYILPLKSQPWLAAGEESSRMDGELFRLTDDPGEQHNLSAIEPVLRQQMLELLHDAAGRALPPLAVEAEDHGPVSPDLQRQLRALGYVDGK